MNGSEMASGRRKEQSRRPSPDAPVVWGALNVEEAEKAIDELAKWVNWLGRRYNLDARVIPSCWSRHGELIEELSALRGAWYSCYGKARSGEDALRWHADFADARTRLADWVARTGCRQGRHQAFDASSADITA